MLFAFLVMLEGPGCLFESYLLDWHIFYTCPVDSG